jgi:hypothetical protein
MAGNATGTGSIYFANGRYTDDEYGEHHRPEHAGSAYPQSEQPILEAGTAVRPKWEIRFNESARITSIGRILSAPGTINISLKTGGYELSGRRSLSVTWPPVGAALNKGWTSHSVARYILGSAMM